MKRIVLGLVAALALTLAAPAAFAQSAPTARQKELASQVLDASGMRENFGAQIKAVMSQLGGSDATAMTKAMAKLQPEYMELFTDIYAKVYSEQELADILAFYKSPGGKAMLGKQTELSRQVIQASMDMAPKIIAALQDQN